MERGSWGHLVIGLGWLVLYGVSVVMAAVRDPSQKKVHWKLVLPYMVGIVPAFSLMFFWENHGLLDTALFVLTSLILTWILIFAVRKQ